MKRKLRFTVSGIGLLLAKITGLWAEDAGPSQTHVSETVTSQGAEVKGEGTTFIIQGEDYDLFNPVTGAVTPSLEQKFFPTPTPLPAPVPPPQVVAPPPPPAPPSSGGSA